MTGPEFDALAVGDVVAERTVNLTRDALVRYAGASGDFNPIHYRDDVAESVGLPGVLAHGMLTMGLAVQPVVDWAGDAGRIVEYQVRFTRPVVVDAAGGADVAVVAKVGSLDPDARVARIDLTVTFEGATRGIEVLPPDEPGTVHVRVQAGESWDDLVAFTVERGFAGMEALSGIPGSVGASPMQNIGAYGQEVADTLVAIEFLDEGAERPRRMTADELELGYRTSVLKRGLRGVVVSVEFALHDTGAERDVLGEALSQPVAYRQLADALGAQIGDRAPLARVRDAVLALRASKGMVIDPADPDSVSAGSFFTNPIVSERVARTLPGDAPRWYLDPEPADEVVPLAELASASPLDAFLAHQASLSASVPEADAVPPDPRVKLSAAWLIERSGIRRGFALPGSRAAISSKHTLALTNRGDATAEEVAQLARFVVSRVQSEFGITLVPEPVFVGVEV